MINGEIRTLFALLFVTQHDELLLQSLLLHLFVMLLFQLPLLLQLLLMLCGKDLLLLLFRKSSEVKNQSSRS